MKERILPLLGEGFIFGVLSQRKKGVEVPYDKVQLRPFLKGGELLYQLTYVHPKKVTHENCTREEAAARVGELLSTVFCQGILYTGEQDYHLLAFGKLKIKTLPPTKEAQEPSSHDVRRQYILEEDGGCDFLIRLGVMGKDGKVLKAKYDKYRQLNKYLEFISSAVDALPGNRRLRIVDFGCGKSYLTFALYYYLVQVLGRDVEIIGLDLKEDVVAFCNEVARDLNYKDLHFLTGDIRGYENRETVDMVVTLHACDTATDDAIVQAVGWGAKVILTVPCCQHELFDKIENPQMGLITKHGILKERLSSLVTDAIRGELLEACGYEVGIMEFIELEHTPKNLLIKAVAKGRPDGKALAAYREFAEFWRVSPYLEGRLRETGALPE